MYKLNSSLAELLMIVARALGGAVVSTDLSYEP
jgi:hypothetical protein